MISLPVKQRESYTNRRTVGHKQTYASTVPDDSRDPGFNWAPGAVKRKGEGSRERGGGGGRNSTLNVVVLGGTFQVSFFFTMTQFGLSWVFFFFKFLWLTAYISSCAQSLAVTKIVYKNNNK